MPADLSNTEQTRTEELTAAIREIQQRVRSRHPNGTLGIGEITVPGLMPLVHARDAADAKVASIGKVNPRPGGLLNSIVQRLKRLVSRSLDWHVREQVEFNRAAMSCVQAIIETFEENNRALSQTASFIHAEASKVHSELASMRAQAIEFNDIRSHWAQWRQGWEEKLNRSEVYMLRTISELNAAAQHRSTLTENEFRQAMREQHAAYEGSLTRAASDIQERVWTDLRNMRAEYEKVIFDELRVVRQRAFAAAPVTTISNAAQPDSGAPKIDWLKFSDRFRGTEETIRAAQSRYTGRFAGASDVLDIGCGRGEFLEAARAAGIPARGIDLSEELVAYCKNRGLDVERADLFEYLSRLPDRSLGGLYCSQVIEHLQPSALPELIRLAAAKLKPGALVAFETPNPECLAIFATHFYIDPTHTRPVPAALLVFYLEEEGFGQVELEKLAPAAGSNPSLNDLEPSVRESFFGGLDYSVFARKL
jgi:2-polyprenyl-3-methyl-5-hydroxy-6-metoxy-1,4-benzoquinol methylase